VNLTCFCLPFVFFLPSISHFLGLPFRTVSRFLFSNGPPRLKHTVVSLLLEISRIYRSSPLIADLGALPSRLCARPTCCIFFSVGSNKMYRVNGSFPPPLSVLLCVRPFTIPDVFVAGTFNSPFVRRTLFVMLRCDSADQFVVYPPF